MIPILSIFTACLISFPVWADHPSEGKKALHEFIIEAQKNNLEIKQLEDNLKALQYKHESLQGRWYPHLFIEGGPQLSQYQNSSENGTLIYGRLNWNLYRGGADRAETQLIEQQINIASKRLSNKKNYIKSEISKIFYEIQFLLESIHLKKKALELNAQQIKIAKLKNSSGLTSSSDVLEFDLRETTLESDLVLLNYKIEKKSREMDVLLSNSKLNEIHPVHGHLIREKFTLDREAILLKILESNEEILQAQAELVILENEKKLTNAAYWPQVDFDLKYGSLNSEKQASKLSNDYSMNLKVSIPIFSGMENHLQLKGIEQKWAAHNKSKSQTLIQLQETVDSAIAELKALNARLDLEEKNIEKSEKYYQLTFDEYKRGTKNSPDMVGASERLLDARIRNLEYRLELHLLIAKMKELSGE